MESFSELLHKLREAHEQEVEGWQEKVQELSNKKGCDSKRMEELFSRNQQMREQQRLLTDNIKTLENRLRAGLCDRCTVTQEVAKRRQQEFEASQIQSIHHIRSLAEDISNLKKENKRLKEEVRTLRTALLIEQPSHSTPSEVNQSQSTDFSRCSGPVALVTTATNRASNHTADGASEIRPEQRTEETLSEQRTLRKWNRGQFESYKPLSLGNFVPGSWKVESNMGWTGVGERSVRACREEGLDQHSPLSPSTPPHILLRKNASHHPSPPASDVKPSRHVLHAPMPCRPRPLKGGPISLSWPLSPPMGNGLVNQPSAKSSFPNLIATHSQLPHGSQGRRQPPGHAWPKHSSSLNPLEEQAPLRVRSVPEPEENPAKAPEKKEPYSLQPEKASEEAGLNDGPLDLSEWKKPKSSQPKQEDKSQLVLQKEERENGDSTICQSSLSSPPLPQGSPSSSSPSSQQQGQDSHQLQKPEERSPQGGAGGENTDIEPADKDTDRKANANSDERKGPVFTISLRPGVPVVLLETLNAGLHRKELAPSNGKSSSSPGPGSSSEEVDGDQTESGTENHKSSKRKRAILDSDTDRSSDTDATQQERKMKIREGALPSSPSYKGQG